jgi:hypothetical protein
MLAYFQASPFGSGVTKRVSNHAFGEKIIALEPSQHQHQK